MMPQFRLGGWPVDLLNLHAFMIHVERLANGGKRLDIYLQEGDPRQIAVSLTRTQAKVLREDLQEGTIFREGRR